ncbi:MAG TPA: hypothetical protein ENF41_04370 [Candidatus Bathyarchaeota archaeon]|nr:hypothetical protein [Candidatus Bathyarchaeota archaeon]
MYVLDRVRKRIRNRLYRQMRIQDEEYEYEYDNVLRIEWYPREGKVELTLGSITGVEEEKVVYYDVFGLNVHSDSPTLKYEFSSKDDKITIELWSEPPSEDRYFMKTVYDPENHILEIYRGLLAII